MSLKVTPKDFFLWVGAMIALYGSAFALLALLFQYIDHAFPDPLAYYVDPYSGGMRFAMASLIVLVPVALILMRFIRKDINRYSEKADLWVRRWALVLTVFIAGSTVVGDLIAVINAFLGGDLTTRFVLKVAVVLLVAGAIFLHFLADLRGYWNANPWRAQMVGWAAGILVLLAIIAGFFIMGTPGEIRSYRFDGDRVRHLQDIQWQVVNYWQQKQKLPAALQELEDPISGYRIPLDAETGTLYEYRVIGERSFELCATFNTDSGFAATPPQVYPARYIDGIENDNWLHKEGRQCFDRSIDPERYPPFEKPVPVR